MSGTFQQEFLAAIAKQAHAEGLGLRGAAITRGGVSAAQFDAWVRPEHMV